VSAAAPRPPLPLHDASRLWSARSRRGDPARYSAIGIRACPSASTRTSSRTWRAGRNAVYRLAALADRRAARGRRCIRRAIFPYLQCRRFVHIKHKVINCELLATSSGIIAGIIEAGSGPMRGSPRALNTRGAPTAEKRELARADREERQGPSGAARGGDAAVRLDVRSDSVVT
jgi:hypothetical protein